MFRLVSDFVGAFPVYLVVEIGGLIAVYLKPRLKERFGAIKWHIASLTAAAITIVVALMLRMF